MEPTSEQELKQLLDEGRITEDEYKELLEAIRQKETVQKPVEKPNEPKLRTGYGKAALILMTTGFLLPLVPLVVNVIMSMQTTSGSTPRMVMFTGCPFLFLGFLCLLLAFIFGVIGWKTTPGKIAAIGVPCLGLLILPGLLLLGVFGLRDVRVPVAGEEPEQSQIRNFFTHRSHSLDYLDGVLTHEGVEIDNNIFAQGTGSLKVEYDKPETRTIRLFETGPISIDNRMLVYSAKLRASGMGGKAYLEMLCHIPGSGEFFSRSIDQPVTQTTWTTVQTPFRLETGYRPDNVKLNLVVEGPGTVWIDDIKLLSSPLTSSSDCIYIEPVSVENDEYGKGVHPVNSPLY